jgi:2-succinyl-6-hydroxy-2,4-cyclohexadiene-1-carboxylate synthase
MLHGFTGSPASFARLEVCGSAVIPTLGGHLAEPPSSDFSSEVERLAALSPAATELFGYSLGGRLALGLLARYPQRFTRAVIVSAHPGLRTTEERVARQKHDYRFVKQLRERGLAEFIAKWEKLPMWSSQWALSESAKADKHLERLGHRAEGLAGSLMSVGLGQMPDLSAALANTECAIDFLVGARDAKFLALAQHLCRIMPRARLAVAANAGHDLVLERPDFCSTYLSQGPSR